MTVRAKIDPEAVLLSVVATGVTVPKTPESEGRSPGKSSQGDPPSTPKLHMTCDGLKDRGLALDSGDPHMDRFMHVKREIYKYTGKDYTYGGGICWTLDR